MTPITEEHAIKWGFTKTYDRGGKKQYCLDYGTPGNQVVIETMPKGWFLHVRFNGLSIGMPTTYFVEEAILTFAKLNITLPK